MANLTTTTATTLIRLLLDNASAPYFTDAEIASFLELSIKEFIDNNLDHRHLNDCIDYKTTAENLAFIFFQEFVVKIEELGGTLTKVIVRETDKTFASYSEQ